MRLFWELCQRSFQRQLTYRVATVAGLLTNFFFGMLRAAVMVALYGARLEVAGYSLQSAITYTGLSQATIGFVSLFSWAELMNTVYTGSIAADLLKPISYYRFWLAQDLGRAVAQLLLRGLPMMIAYALMFGIPTPTSLFQWLALFLVLILAWLVSFAWRFLVNLAAFWIPNAVGIARFAFIISWFLSGFLMPLNYYPDWFVKLCLLTPFPHMISTIFEVYLGLVKGYDLVVAILLQLLWAVALIALGQVVLRQGVRRLVILGG